MQRNINRAIFEMYIEFARAKTGITLPQTNYRNVMEFITKRVNKLDINYTDYLEMLKSDYKEYERFINTIMIGETYFFREDKHFHILKNYILPLYKNKKKVILWSATCSTGEEAISMGLIAHNYLYLPYKTDYVVIASDINTFALDRFKSGIYSKSSFKKASSRYMPLIKRYIVNGRIKLPPEINDRIIIKTINLYTDDIGTIRADVVFFRNTLIYCNMNDKKIMLSRVVSAINDGGYLFVGVSEVPFVELDNLETMCIENTYFFKKGRVYGV